MISIIYLLSMDLLSNLIYTFKYRFIFILIHNITPVNICNIHYIYLRYPVGYVSPENSE